MLRGGTLRVAQPEDIATLDPWTADGDATFQVVRQVFEPLVDVDPATLRAVPLLATKWTASTDARVWTFTLRTGVKFHDGTPLDAAAVVYNFQRGLQLPRLGLDAIVDSVTTSDTSTVVFTLRAPYAPFLATLAEPAFGIVSPACVKQGATWSTPATRCAAGTGPFRIEPGAWQSGAKVALVRNASYWATDDAGRRLPFLDGVTFAVARDENARVGSLKAAQVDLALGLGAAGARAVRADPNLVLSHRPVFDLVFIGFGLSSGPLDSVDVRRAVALAVDRVGLAQGVYGGEAKPASQVIPPGLVGFDDSVTQFTATDVTAAKKALADGGYPSGFVIDLWYSPDATTALPDPKRVADSLAADLAKIGVTVTVRAEDADTFAGDVKARRLPLWLGVRAPARADPDDFMTDATADPIGLELLRRARGEADPSKRAELYKQVSKLVQQQVARIPLLHVDAPLGLSRKVNLLVPRAVGAEPFTTIWMGQ